MKQCTNCIHNGIFYRHFNTSKKTHNLTHHLFTMGGVELCDFGQTSVPVHWTHSRGDLRINLSSPNLASCPVSVHLAIPRHPGITGYLHPALLPLFSTPIFLASPLPLTPTSPRSSPHPNLFVSPPFSTFYFLTPPSILTSTSSPP